MGARAAYTLATAIFVGAAGIFGYFDWIFFIIPKAVIFPILIFIGLEITSQSFHATAPRHFPAVALACVPALAYLALLAINQVLPEVGKPFADLRPHTQHWIQSVTMLAGGFIVTSLLWGTALAHLIDGRVRPVVATLMIAAVFSWFGVIHSPLPSNPIMPPAAVLSQLKAAGPPGGECGPNALPLGSGLRAHGVCHRALESVRAPSHVSGNRVSQAGLIMPSIFWLIRARFRKDPQGEGWYMDVGVSALYAEASRDSSRGPDLTGMGSVGMRIARLGMV